MNHKAQVMLKALLSSSEHQDELYQFFDPRLVEKLNLLKTPSDFTPKTFFSSTDNLEKIHFSWIAQTIQSYPQALQPHFLSLLTEKQATGIQAVVEQSGKQLSPFLKPYLAHILHNELVEPDISDEQHLPDSPLMILLHFERKSLIHLCDLLGLCDLATDLRQIVDKTLLAKIRSVLSAPQLKFLEYCSKQPMKWVSPKLGLLSWDGSQQQLNKILHSRGLIRLAKAISQEEDSFKWHLLHRLDTGRAKIIQKEFYKKQDPLLSSYFRNQVLQIAKKIRLPNNIDTI